MYSSVSSSSSSPSSSIPSFVLDTTFFVGIQEKDLDNIGLLDSLTGRVSVLKILEAAGSLPTNDIPDAIPATLDEWLRSINLECYAANFAHMGYQQSDLRFIETIDDAELKALGIRKQGHLAKMKRAIKKLAKLQYQGRTAEVSTDESRRNNAIRDLVKTMKVTTLDDTKVKNRLWFSDEESFWTQVCHREKQKKKKKKKKKKKN